MLKSTVLDYFDNNVRTIARVLDLSTVAIYKWGEIVPYWVALELKRKTKGKLVVDRELYARGRPLKGEELSRVFARRSESTADDVQVANLTPR